MVSIGKLSEQCGVKVPTIRYYEEIGLLPQPARTSGNQRRYTEEHKKRLEFIRHARDLGFSVDAIRDLIALGQSPTESCERVDEIAMEHLQDVRAKIEKLTRLQNELQRMLEQCKHGAIESCHVLEVISDHGQCSDVH